MAKEKGDELSVINDNTKLGNVEQDNDPLTKQIPYGASTL